MPTRTAFLVPSPRIPAILLSVICLLAPVKAQHGGGGGHSGGGHSSGTHSGGSHAGGLFGWLHFGFGKHSARRAQFKASPASDISHHLPSDLWNLAAAARRPSILGPTLLWSPPLLPPRPGGRVAFVSSRVRHYPPGFFRHRFPRFSSSGCFFNGVTQVCFFEPILPLFCFGGDFDTFYWGFGFGGDSSDLGDDSQETTQLEMSEIPPTANPSDDDSAEENSSVRPGATLDGATEDQSVGKRVFLLVLKNGTSHAVTDYSVTDGYLEYISTNGTRSHIPLEALDLQNTAVRNARRGLPFVLRSSPPAQNR